jgi:hypothetical protein
MQNIAQKDALLAQTRVANHPSSSSMVLSSEARPTFSSSAGKFSKQPSGLKRGHGIVAPTSDLFEEIEDVDALHHRPDQHDYVWGDLKRTRGGDFCSRPGHDRVLKNARKVFVAQVISGVIGSDPWADRDHGVASDAIKQIWIDCAKEIRSNIGRYSPKIDKVPEQEEARQVRDTGYHKTIR